MKDDKELREKFEAMKREILERRHASILEMDPNRKVVAKPICTTCGGYVQKAAVYLSKKYEDYFMFDMPCCIYCLSRAMDRSVEDLKAEYNADT